MGVNHYRESQQHQRTPWILTVPPGSTTGQKGAKLFYPGWVSHPPPLQTTLVRSASLWTNLNPHMHSACVPSHGLVPNGIFWLFWECFPLNACHSPWAPTLPSPSRLPHVPSFCTAHSSQLYTFSYLHMHPSQVSSHNLPLPAETPILQINYSQNKTFYIKPVYSNRDRTWNLRLLQINLSLKCNLVPYLPTWKEKKKRRPSEERLNEARGIKPANFSEIPVNPFLSQWSKLCFNFFLILYSTSMHFYFVTTFIYLPQTTVF